jgi:hypothetical protein
MDNTRQIQPLTLWINGRTEQVDRLMLYNFGGYDFAGGADCYVSYKLGVIIPASDGFGKDGFKSLAENSVKLPAELVAEWGEDDEPIWQYVLTELGLAEVA